MGQFADFDDVAAEFEGTLPESKAAWVNAKIDAVEARLIGLVPSLETLTEASDPARFSRAKHLVVEKVLQLYRNPTGVRQQTAGVYSAAYSTSAGSNTIMFTDAELSTLRQRVRRANLGTARIAPWRADRAPGVLRRW